MRVAANAEEVESMMAQARSEALSGFGDDTIYIEKYLQNPHHIEFQILADTYGNVLNLYERECSVQVWSLAPMTVFRPLAFSMG